MKKLQRQVREKEPSRATADTFVNRRQFRFQSGFHAFLLAFNVNGLSRFGREVGLSCERLNLARKE